MVLNKGTKPNEYLTEKKHGTELVSLLLNNKEQGVYPRSGLILYFLIEVVPLSFSPPSLSLSLCVSFAVSLSFYIYIYMNRGNENERK